MVKIVLDAETAEKLRSAGQCLELRDANDKVVGYFRPAVDSELYRTIKEPFTEEELERFRREPGGRSLAEIMRDLQAKT